MSDLAARLRALADRFASPATSTIAPADRAKYAAIANDLRALLTEDESTGQPAGKSEGLDDAGPVPTLDSPRRQSPANSDDAEALADSIGGCFSNTSDLPQWMRMPALGRYMRPLVEIAARAVLASDWLAERERAAEARGVEQGVDSTWHLKQIIALKQAEALRQFADTLGVNVGDEDDDWWKGYRQGQREALHKAVERADRIEARP